MAETTAVATDRRAPDSDTAQFRQTTQQLSSDPDRVAWASDVVAHPNAFQSRSAPDDVAVVILAEPVTDIEPIELPTEGFLGEAATHGELVDHSFVNVGYEFVPNDRQRPAFEFDGVRRVSTSPYKGLTLAFLLLNMRTDATGEGGSC